MQRSHDNRGAILNPITSSTNEIKLSYAADSSRMDELYDVLDELHSAASENELHTFTSMNEHDVVDFLRDLIYTAQQTIEEIEQRAKGRNKKRPSNVIEFRPGGLAPERGA